MIDLFGLFKEQLFSYLNLFIIFFEITEFVFVKTSKRNIEKNTFFANNQHRHLINIFNIKNRDAVHISPVYSTNDLFLLFHKLIIIFHPMLVVWNLIFLYFEFHWNASIWANFLFVLNCYDYDYDYFLPFSLNFLLR